MRYRYIIYPRAREILEKSGLTDRLKKAHNDSFIGILSYMLNSEIINWVKDMKTKGWFERIPEDERASFFKALNNAYKKIGSGAHWKIKRFDGEYKEPFEIEDFIILAGCRASQLLCKEELFDYMRFGFSNVGEMTGTIGAAIEEKVHDYSFRSGLKWQTKRPDGRILVNEITGDNHSDLRIYQNDITPYETIDPLGNNVFYRPRTDPDNGTVAAADTNEGELFTAVLKWIEQLQIESDSLKEKGSEIIRLVRSLGQGGETCAEHFRGCDDDARMFFIRWNCPIPRLDASGSSTERTPFYLTTQSEGAYGVYIGRNNELIISYDVIHKGVLNPTKKVSVSFLPSEADNVIRGLMYQCAKGLGRTSAQQIVEILEHRFSPQFQRDMDRRL